MSDERDLAQDVNAGQQASSIVANPAYRAAMSALKSGIEQEWRNCPIRDMEGQQLLLQLAKIADKFEGLLAGAIETGRVAKIKLDDVRRESNASRLMRRIF